MTPAVVQSVFDLRQRLNPLRAEGVRIGLVPTMGALHSAHAHLIRAARDENDLVVVSIFVNPLQFGPAEDYSRYPRSLEKDLSVCAENGAAIVFAPEVQAMYPLPQRTFIDVTGVSEYLCGLHRPGHFRGVATVVLKLLNIVQPDRAYFGEKDYQQLCVIRRMVEDLNLPIGVIAFPTVREPDGLAMSSRNVYLDGPQRTSATVLFRALELARRMIESGERRADRVKAAAMELIAQERAVDLEYLEVIDTAEVQPVGVIDRPVRVAGAIRIGGTRLIDNVAAQAGTRSGPGS